eukprot:gene12142-13804_t
MLLKRGRPSHAVWKYYNDSGECSHCGYSSHCRKAERAVQHLRNCVNFQLQVHSGAASLPTFLNNTVHERNSSSNDVLTPPLKKDELKCFQELFVQGLYEAGAPFTLLEQPAIKEATKLLRPNASLPTRHAAASTLLVTNYAKSKEQIYQEMRENTEILTLQADGAKGNDNYPYIHHCITSPTQGYIRENDATRSSRIKEQLLALQEDKLLMQEYGDPLYLAMNNQANPTHPLKYWERKRETWPELYEVATVLLAVTPVTAFTKRSFSMTKRTMRAERPSLGVVSASKLSFLKVDARSIKKRRVNQEEMEQVYETPYET